MSFYFSFFTFPCNSFVFPCFLNEISVGSSHFIIKRTSSFLTRRPCSLHQVFPLIQIPWKSYPCLHFLLLRFTGTHGISQSSQSRLQLVQDDAARLLMGARKRDLIRPILVCLHWLPVQFRVDIEGPDVFEDLHFWPSNPFFHFSSKDSQVI